MKISSLWREVLLLAVALAGLQTVQACLLKDALARLDSLAARRLQAGVAGVLHHAHKSKDDISIVQVLSALNRAPGVVRAQLLGPEGKGLSGPGIYSYPLKDETKRWGSLVLSLSDHARRRLVRRQWVVGTASTVLVWMLLSLYFQFLTRRCAVLQTQTVELREMLESAERQFNALAERERLSVAKAAICLQQAVDGIATPVIVLDSHQRVAAINASSLSRLGLSRAPEVLLKSWHEVPLLQSCGVLLEQSLLSPLAELQASTPVDGPVLSLMTLQDGAGTWVKLFGPSGVAK